VNQLALAETSYLVGDSTLAMADPELQYTTRGIIRRVMETTEPENGLVTETSEVSFDVQSINFEFGSDQLKEQGIRQLNEFGAALVSPELEQLKLRVAGHTDDQGESDYNLDLSRRRAETVANYLEENFDVTTDRLEVIGMGEEKPLIAERTLAARAKNRRVEMVFIAE
jgi:outer membrane protein OmpA-like peptidoglycan-associated protein